MSDQQELDQLAEAEYSRLQRQLRSMENELQGLMYDKKLKLKKQNRIISTLQKEYEKLKSDIEILLNGSHAKKQTELERRLENKMFQHEHMQKILKQEKDNIWELEGHLKKLEKEIDGLRKNEVTDICYKETISKVQKDVVKLENRLDVTNKKNSAVLTENTKLRESIDHMLRDRAHFNDMWQCMVTQFNQGKKTIVDLIEQSTVAYDQREELCTKLQTLKERNESDRLIHIQEMRELQRKLEHDAKLQQFYDAKGQRRVNAELEQREADKKLQFRENLEKKLDDYQKIIERIKILSQENNIEFLAQKFTKQEDENFALFSYVNELSHEVEVLNEIVQKLGYEIETQKTLEQENAYKRVTETIEYLEGRKSENMSKTDKAITMKKMLEKQLKELLEGIEKIFLLIKCDDAPILNVLGTKNFLTLHNVKLFLGVIDKRIHTIVSNINFEETSSRILAKKDRIPKFNVKESAKIKNFK